MYLENVWVRWMQLWGTDESIKKSETNLKNRRDCREVVVGTHTGGSISIGEYRKRLVNIFLSNYLSHIMVFDINTCFLNTHNTIDMIFSKSDLSSVQAIQKGRDPTPAELHLHVHTHGHDWKSFVDDHSRMVHVSAKL